METIDWVVMGCGWWPVLIPRPRLASDKFGSKRIVLTRSKGYSAIFSNELKQKAWQCTQHGCRGIQCPDSNKGSHTFSTPFSIFREWRCGTIALALDCGGAIL